MVPDWRNGHSQFDLFDVSHMQSRHQRRRTQYVRERVAEQSINCIYELMPWNLAARLNPPEES